MNDVVGGDLWVAGTCRHCLDATRVSRQYGLCGPCHKTGLLRELYTRRPLKRRAWVDGKRAALGKDN